MRHFTVGAIALSFILALMPLLSAAQDYNDFSGTIENVSSRIRAMNIVIKGQWNSEYDVEVVRDGGRERWKDDDGRDHFDQCEECCAKAEHVVRRLIVSGDKVNEFGFIVGHDTLQRSWGKGYASPKYMKENNAVYWLDCSAIGAGSDVVDQDIEFEFLPICTEGTSICTIRSIAHVQRGGTVFNPVPVRFKTSTVISIEDVDLTKGR